MESFDVIIIGAGSAGCLAAYSAAKSGLERIALIDRKEKKLIGRKICGDGIGTKHLEFLQEKGFPLKENNILLNSIKNAYIIAPDPSIENKLPVDGQLAIIDRHKFGQTLLDTAISFDNIKLYDNTIFKEAQRRNGEMIIHLQKDSGETFTLKTPLIIDASGFNSKIREGSGFFDEYATVTNREQYYCYREICELESPSEKYEDSAIFEFSYEKTRGGYIWFFHRGENQWNMGNGVPKFWIKSVSPKEIYQKYMATRFSQKTILDAGGGFVPTRQPLPNHVADNIILTGDAGLIVNPLHGGGLSPSLASGYVAGKLAANFVPNETLKQQDMWSYNLQLMERYGVRYSILDIYRLSLQNIPDEELTHAIANEYLPLGKIFYAREYDLLVKLSKKLGEIWQELPNPRFNLLPEAIEKITTLTNNYPKNVDDIDSWAKQYKQIYDNHQTKISI
jgi:geranylgeranyl reductase family protein